MALLMVPIWALGGEGGHDLHRVLDLCQCGWRHRSVDRIAERMPQVIKQGVKGFHL